MVLVCAMRPTTLNRAIRRLGRRTSGSRIAQERGSAGPNGEKNAADACGTKESGTFALLEECEIQQLRFWDPPVNTVRT